jgi:cytidine deaminase
MSPISDSLAPPELFFGVAGPIGVNIEAICDSLANALRLVRYDSTQIHLTKEMMSYSLPLSPGKSPDGDFYTEVSFKIKYANALCAEFKDPATLARIALRSISNARAQRSGDPKTPPKTGFAYIIRQLKRPDEVTLLRKVYGKQFILTSAYGSVEQRQADLPRFFGPRLA